MIEPSDYTGLKGPGYVQYIRKATILVIQNAGLISIVAIFIRHPWTDNLSIKHSKPSKTLHILLKTNKTPSLNPRVLAGIIIELSQIWVIIDHRKKNL